MGQPKSVALSCFLYRAVLLLGPSTFRMELQPLLLSDFRHLCLYAYAHAGAEGVFALLPNHMLHTFCDICGEHFDLVKLWASKIEEEFLNSLEKRDEIDIIVDEKKIKIEEEFLNFLEKRDGISVIVDEKKLKIENISRVTFEAMEAMEVCNSKSSQQKRKNKRAKTL